MLIDLLWRLFQKAKNTLFPLGIGALMEHMP
jgi:hypothetical protein